MRKIERLLLQVVMAFFVLPVFAQNGVNSPYSRYGVGLLSDQGVGINKAMGNFGIGLRERNTLNTLNPASYSTVDTLTFLFDAGFSLSNLHIKENGVRTNARNASFDYVAMQFRIVRNLGCTISYLPFSNVGYSFSQSELLREDIDGEITATNSYAGEGGLRQFAFGLGWAPFKFLSFGADFAYLSGQITHVISNKYSDASILSRNKTYYAEMRGFKSNIGMQATAKLRDGKLTLGLLYSPKVNFRGDGLMYDEMLDGTTSEVSDTLSTFKDFSVPFRMGAGISYSREKWLVGFDVNYEAWSNAIFMSEGGIDGRDRIKMSLGGRLQLDKTHHNLFHRSSYMAGCFMSQPYYNIGSDKGPTEYGVSLGISLPVINAWNNMIEFNVVGQYVHVSPTDIKYIEENYFRLCLGIAFNERWFTKWKVN